MNQNWRFSKMWDQIPSVSRKRGFLVPKLGMIAIAALLTPQASVMLRAQDLIPANLPLGRNLEANTQIKLSGPAPKEGLVITVRSNDAGRLLISKDPLAAGSESIEVKVDGGRSQTTEFYLQALADSGTVTYTVSAPDHASSTGSVTLVPSALVIAGNPLAGNPLVTVSGAPPSKIYVTSSQMDESGQFSIIRKVRGGLSLKVQLDSSDPKVGTMDPPLITIPAGDFRATTQFMPVSPGNITLAVKATPDFHGAPAMNVIVNMPGLGITDRAIVGKNLEIEGSLGLGAIAPPGGVTVTITSSDPTKLLLSTSGSVLGSKSIALTIPAGERSGRYFLQALADSGVVTYDAVGPGYRERQASVVLTPSGVLMGAPDPPDERDVLRPDGPEPPRGFYVLLSTHRSTQIGFYMAYLNPTTLRGADITTELLLPGLSLTIPLANSNPAVGAVPASVTIMGGTREALVDFKMLTPGSTVLSIPTPPGFVTPSNAQFVKGIVVE